MKNRKWSVSMRMKIVLLCTVGTLSALIVQTAFFQYTSSRQIYNQARDTSLNSMKNMQDDISTFIESIEDRMSLLYLQSDFINDLANDSSLSELRDQYGNELNYNITHRFAITNFDSSFGIKAVYIYNNAHQLISSYRLSYSPKYSYPSDIYNVKGNNISVVRNYLKSDEKKILISSYYNEKRGEDIIRLVSKIFYKNATITIGYIVCDIDQRAFSKIIKKYVYSDDQIVWLQSKGDRPIIRVGELSEKQRPYYNHAVQLMQDNSSLISSGVATKGSEFFAIPYKKYNFSVFSLTPRELLEVNQQVLTRNLIIIVLLLIPVFMVSSVLMAQNITNPLTKMVETMTKIKNGNTTLRVVNCKNDEIGKLGENFNNMLDTIETLILEEYQSQMAMNNAKYKALQAQVNPHFLYNTLETMSSIASSQKCDTVSNLCKALSNLFRYSLDMKDPLSTIEDEIKHIKNYMYVINVREDNTIEFQIDIDNRLLKESIPRLSIQPLIENSIQHGLRNKRGDKKIWLRGVREGDNIIISVSDNGVGMDADQINKQLGNSSLDVLDKKSSIGLNNINARVKILFGDHYGVKVYSKNGEGSTVSLYVPHMGAGEDNQWMKNSIEF